MTKWKRTFTIVYTGQAFSITGSSAVQFAILWYLTTETGSAEVLSAAALALFLPSVILGPFAGVWIDRWNRKLVIILADMTVALSSACTAAVFLLSQNPPLWIIFVLLFLRGLGNTFHTPAMQAVMPTIVPNEILAKAGGWSSLISSISTMAGPALGALLMISLSLAQVMLVDIIGAAAAVLTLAFTSIPNIVQHGPKRNMKEEMKTGMKALWENRQLKAALLPIMASTILYMPLGTFFPLLVSQHYMKTAGHNAIVEMLFSSGLLLSSLVIGITGGIKRKFLMISMAIGVLGASALIGGLLPSYLFPVFAVCSLLMGTSGPFFSVPLTTYMQETIPPEMLGKVFTLYTAAMTLASPAGLLLAGPITERIGVSAWFIISGVLMMLAGITCHIATRKE